MLSIQPAGPPGPIDSPPQTEPSRSEPLRQPDRGPLAVALFVVAVMAASALFVSGYTLGRQQATSPGTSESLEQQFQPFWDAYHKIDQEYVGEVDRHALVEGAIGGLFEALDDPFSGYMTSEEYRNSLSSIGGQFEGIGAEMATRGESDEPGCDPLGPTCRLFVFRTIPDSPADKAGLKADDQVVAVDGESIDGQTLEETVSRVRGPRGTVVRLTVVRGGAAPIELSITRDVIRQQEVRSEVLAEGQVGYIQIDGFNDGSAEDFKAQLATLVQEQGMKRLILDLRDDPGGFVTAARTIASQFIGSGPIYWEETARGTQTATEAEPGGLATDPGIQLVVLVNGGTASASEIVAAALQDTGRATIVGQATYGKGTIQQWQLLPNDSGGIRLSVAKWLTPDKRWIHETGVQPDVSVETPDPPVEGDDPVLERALEILIGRSAQGVLDPRMAA